MIETSDTEVIDAIPVIAGEPRSRQLATRSVAPVVQTAAVAAGGFVAGAVVVGVLGHRRRRQRTLAAPGARRIARGRSADELVEIVSSRSMLVNVHLLGSPGGNR